MKIWGDSLLKLEEDLSNAKYQGMLQNVLWCVVYIAVDHIFLILCCFA